MVRVLVEGKRKGTFTSSSVRNERSGDVMMKVGNPRTSTSVWVPREGLSDIEYWTDGRTDSLTRSF